jgi:DtxR family Mn-dependent transcriptional regulator
MPSRDVTASAEDYLKAIFAIEDDGVAVGTNALAHRVGVGATSASHMMRKLAEDGLVSVEPYRGARLTPAGRRVALRTMRRHRILECYLAKALGYPWDRVHAEAERLEHAASDALIERMAASLGNPVVDPHGAPIPTADGSIDNVVHRSVAELATGERTRVSRVRADDAGMLRYLDGLGIRLGASIAVTARAPFEGPISLVVDGVTRSIGPSLAARVLVAGGGG